MCIYIVYLTLHQGLSNQRIVNQQPTGFQWMGQSFGTGHRPGKLGNWGQHDATGSCHHYDWMIWGLRSNLFSCFRVEYGPDHCSWSWQWSQVFTQLQLPMLYFYTFLMKASIDKPWQIDTVTVTPNQSLLAIIFCIDLLKRWDTSNLNLHTDSNDLNPDDRKEKQL